MKRLVRIFVYKVVFFRLCMCGAEGIRQALRGKPVVCCVASASQHTTTRYASRGYTAAAPDSGVSTFVTSMITTNTASAMR